MMNSNEWHTKFIARLISRGLKREEAEDTLAGNMGDHDYEDDPKDAADDELTYWTDDG